MFVSNLNAQSIIVNTNKLFIEKINELKDVENQAKDNKFDKDKKAEKKQTEKITPEK